MKPESKEELRDLVSEKTRDVYEALAPQLIQMIDMTKKREDLTLDQINDEVLLHMMGYVKSCTNEIIVQVLGDILELTENPEGHDHHEHDHGHSHDHGHAHGHDHH